MKATSFVKSAVLKTTFVMFCFTFVTSNSSANALYSPNLDTSIFPPKWEKLGQRKVDYKLDKDEIYVTAKEGRFTAIKLGVRKAAVNFHKVTVHYRNGSTQNIKIKNRIAPGNATRTINLDGNRRIVKKVVFWYDTKNSGYQKAVVELWGKH